MKRTFLMPHWCKITGLILTGLMVSYWTYLLIRIGVDPSFSITPPDNIYVVAAHEQIVLAVLMLLIAFSREKDEDEYVASVRGRCLMLAFYVDFVFLIITSLMIRDEHGFYLVAHGQIFMILLLHIVMFNTAMAVIRRRRSREE